MPIINVKLGTTEDPQLAEKVNASIVALSSSILKKDHQLTATTIQFIKPEYWFIAGKTLAALRQSSFYFDIKIVDGSNTKDEKALFIKSCFEKMAEILGNVHPESYIYVEDVQASAYGFGGYTQEYRYIYKNYLQK